MATVKVSKNRQISVASKLKNSQGEKSVKKLKLEWVRNPTIFAAVLGVFKNKDTGDTENEVVVDVAKETPVRKQKVSKIDCCDFV